PLSVNSSGRSPVTPSAANGAASTMPGSGWPTFAVAMVAIRRKYCSLGTSGAAQAASARAPISRTVRIVQRISLSPDRFQALVRRGTAAGQEQARILADQPAELVHVARGPFEIAGDRVDIRRDR